jgi:DNA-binding response OmpR family regulator
MSSETPTVLIVEDNRALADMYAEWLAETHSVIVAYDGDEAIDSLSERIDVVLLDRIMPERSGESVLETIRSRELDCRVGIVTAVEPQFDILELGFDDYIVKPVLKGDLYHIVEQLLTRSSYTPAYREYHALSEKRAVLRETMTDETLASNSAYTELDATVKRLREQLHRVDEKWSSREHVGTVFRRLSHLMGSRSDGSDETDPERANAK